MYLKISNIVFVILIVLSEVAFGQSSDLATQIHLFIKNQDYNLDPGKGWDDDKKFLSGYDKTIVAKALIAEFDTNLRNDQFRDKAISEFYKQLNCPVSVITSEFKKNLTPYRKYQLMICLPKTNSSEVISNLVALTKEKAVPFPENFDGDVRDLRVCDYACFILAEDMGAPRPEINIGTSDEEADQVISKTLKNLKLDAK